MNTINNRVWDEMYNVYGYILQIEFYTDKKRKCNRNVSYTTVICAVISAITAFFPDCKWGTMAASIIVAVLTIIKEWVPNILQPESELKELDEIHVFYKDYFQKLEKLFMDRQEPIINDAEMTSQFDKIKKTEKDKETRLNNLIWKISDKDLEKLNKQTQEYFDRTYHGKYKDTNNEEE